jgi:hypothetical protein
MTNVRNGCFLLCVVIVISLLLFVKGYSVSDDRTITVAFGGDTLFGGYYQSSDPQFGTMDALAQMIGRYIRDYGEGEGIKRFVAYALQNIRPMVARAVAGAIIKRSEARGPDQSYRAEIS